MRPHRTLFALYLLFLGEVFRIEGAGRVQDSEDHDADVGEDGHPHIGDTQSTQQQAGRLDGQSKDDVLVDDALGAAGNAHGGRAFRAAAPQTLPVFAGYWVLGLGYGIYVQSLGLPVWLPPLMGTVVYGGSLEFVLASLLLGSFAPVSAFLMALMIQARHLFYGLTMLQRYRGYGLRSAYMIFAMSDETFSITCSAEPPEGVDKGWFMFFITLLDQIYWVASAAMGAALGSVLPFSTEGVDFVMTAMFVVIFLNQWEKEKQHASAIIGIAAPLVCLRIFGSGSFLIPSMVCILVALLLLRRPIEAKESEAAK